LSFKISNLGNPKWLVSKEIPIAINAMTIAQGILFGYLILR